MTTFKHLLITALAAAGLTFAAGCKHIPLDATGQNVGAFNYGEFIGLLNTTSPVVVKATHDAVKQLGLTEVAATNQKFSGDIVARDENDMEVTIRIRETNSRQTALRIRWGKGGDLDRSRQLYDLVNNAVSGVPTTTTGVVR